MDLREIEYIPVDRYSEGQIITIPGTRNVPFMRIIDGIVNLTTLEKTRLERGEAPIMAKALDKFDIMRKYKFSHVQYDGWQEYVEKHIKPKFIKESK